MCKIGVRIFFGVDDGGFRGCRGSCGSGGVFSVCMCRQLFCQAVHSTAAKVGLCIGARDGIGQS